MTSKELLGELNVTLNNNTFEDLAKYITDLHNKKNHDYGNSFDKSLNEFGLVASAVRMSDKINRFKTLINQSAVVKDEKIDDTLLDLASYAIMTVSWIRNQK